MPLLWEKLLSGIPHHQALEQPHGKRAPVNAPNTELASTAFVFYACQSQPLVRQSSKESRINSFCAQLAVGFQIGVPSKCSLDSNVDIIKNAFIYL